MQFTMNHKVGDKFTNVEFKANIVTLKLLNMEQLKHTFQRIGGVMQSDYTFNFPLFITSEVLSEVIHNTCFVCGGLMQNGTAIQNGKVLVSSYDSVANTYQGEIEYPNPKESKVIKVRKCLGCGHSHTL